MQRARGTQVGSDAPSAKTEPEDGGEPAVPGDVREPVMFADVTLLSHRRYQLAAGPERDSVTVRGAGGEVLLHLEMTAQGPILRFSGAEVELVAKGKLRLAARDVTIEAEHDVELRAGGSLHERAGEHHHIRAGRDARVEAGSVQIQASEGGAAVRAMQKISLDGERIGLNDDPAPTPFPWSSLADDDASAKDPDANGEEA